MKKRLFSRLMFLLMTTIILSSCEEETDLRLDRDMTSMLIVDGWILDDRDEQTIRLLSTVPYDSNTPCPPATGASVHVSDGGRTWVFNESEPGIYSASGFRGEPGKTYNLEIIYNSEKFTATSTMKKSFQIDSLAVDIFPYGLPADLPHYQVYVYGQDDPEPDQFYVFQYAKNGNWNDTLFYWSFLSDLTINGKYVEKAPLSIIETYSDRFDLQLRSLSVEQEYLLFVDQVFYNYMPNMFFSPPKANVYGNISKGAFGYFAAASVSTSEKVTIRKSDYFLK